MAQASGEACRKTCLPRSNLRPASVGLCGRSRGNVAAGSGRRRSVHGAAAIVTRNGHQHTTIGGEALGGSGLGSTARGSQESHRQQCCASRQYPHSVHVSPSPGSGFSAKYRAHLQLRMDPTIGIELSRPTPCIMAQESMSRCLRGPLKSSAANSLGRSRPAEG